MTGTAVDLLPLDLGDGVLLRATTVADAPAAFAIIDAERIRLGQWLPWEAQTDHVDVEREFLHSVEASNAGGTGVHATIVDGEACLGMVGLRLDSAHRSAEVGYWLSAAGEGRGIMTSAVANLVDLAFGPLGLHRFQLLAATDNLRSRAIAERLGLRHEGTMREAELLAQGYVDLELYAVLASEWSGSASRFAREGSRYRPSVAP